MQVEIENAKDAHFWIRLSHGQCGEVWVGFAGLQRAF